MAQHLSADGAVAPGWPALGKRVSEAGSFEIGYTAIGDGAGGLVVAWSDGRTAPPNTTDSYSNYLHIYAQRFLADGSHAPGWPDSGLAICTAPGSQDTPWLCPDGTGGALIAWEDNRASYGQVYMSRVLGTGAIAPGWPTDGALVADNSAGASDIRLASDTMGGAYVGWYNYSTSRRAFAQHLRGDGTLAPGWATFGTLMVDIASSAQTDVSLVPAEPGNAIMVWYDQRTPGGESIRAQKLVTDGPVPVELSLTSAIATPQAVDLEWRGPGAGLANVSVERSAAGSAWQRIGAPAPDGADALRYEDRTVVAGARYGYRLVDASARVVGAETWVDVPAAARFALAGATPNPARAGELAVRYSLATRAAGTLELLDVSGRRRAYRELASLEPGEHLERMGETRGFEPGLYWLRLSQAGRTLTARVALVR